MSDITLQHIKRLLPELSTAEKFEVLELVTQALRQTLPDQEPAPPKTQKATTEWGRKVAEMLRSEPHTSGWDDVDDVAEWIYQSRRQLRYPEQKD